MLDEKSIWILLNMRNALNYGFILSFEVFTRKLIKRGNPFKKGSEEYNIFEEMEKFYNEEFRDMVKICSVAKKLCK